MEKPEETMPLYEMRKADRRSLVGLYFSQVLLYVGFLLILLNNLGILEPDSYFGAMNWLTIAVFRSVDHKFLLYSMAVSVEF